jgi:hypothetical protein
LMEQSPNLSLQRKKCGVIGSHHDQVWKLHVRPLSVCHRISS